MAKPFTLDGGGYLILLLLLLPLSYSQLHSVQLSEATLRWFDLSDDFALASHSVTMVRTNRSMPLCLQHIQSLTAMASRRLWDPGIWSTVCRVMPTMVADGRHRNPFLPWIADVQRANEWMIDCTYNLSPPSRQLSLLAVPTKWRVFIQGHGCDDNGIGLFKPFAPTILYSRCAISSCRNVLTRLFHSPPSLRPIPDHDVASVDSVDKCRGVLIQSLFQCSHPILSRPTVPNIR